MKRRIFRTILGITLFILLSAFGIVLSYLYSYFAGIEEIRLQDQLELACIGTEQKGYDYLSALPQAGYRLTWTDPDGRVIWDSRAKADTMDNHREREEIREALLFGKGSSVRYSSTLTEKTVYQAKRLIDGSILRISVSSSNIMRLLLTIVPPLIFVLFISSVLCALLASYMTKKIILPLNELDLEEPLSNQTYEELSPLLHRIHQQHCRIETQIQDLAQTKEEFSQIIGYMNEGLVLLDKKGEILSINPAASLLFDAGEEHIGKNVLTLNRSRELRQAMERALSLGKSRLILDKKGSKYQIDLSRINAQEDILGLVLLTFDITDRVFAERNRREFTANVSHELKTPLQSIIGSADLLQNHLVKEKDIPDFLSRIQAESQRLLSLIENILRLSQLDEEVRLPQEKILLSKMVKEVFSALSEFSRTKNIHLSLEGEGGQILGVAHLLYEMIYNLCDNAIRYNIEGGKVLFRIEETRDDIFLSVSDTGIGIADEHKDRIFERFYRGDKSHSSRFKGTGLGLAIVKNTVHYHGGEIALESVLDQGTTFRIRLPKAD